MDEKVLSWASEKFGDELKRIPSSAFFAALLAALLFWAADAGQYKSALLGLLDLSPADMTDEMHGLGKVSLAAYLSAAIGAIALYGMLRESAKRFFSIACQSKAYMEKLESMIRDNKQISEFKQPQLLNELQSAQETLVKRRAQVRQWVEAFYWLELSGGALLACSVKGNVLDAAIGAICVITGIWSLFKAVGIFMLLVTPWYARVEALTELITSNAYNQNN